MILEVQTLLHLPGLGGRSGKGVDNMGEFFPTLLIPCIIGSEGRYVLLSLILYFYSSSPCNSSIHYFLLSNLMYILLEGGFSSGSI